MLYIAYVVYFSVIFNVALKGNGKFCNGIQLNRVLPPGPREYWNQLAVEHHAAPEHQNWMYEADPFAARKVVGERQEKAAKKKEDGGRGQGSADRGPGASDYASAPEAKMATTLRDFVEDAIKKMPYVGVP